MARPTEELFEVYRATSEIAAQKIIDTVLGPEGIGATMHDRQPPMLPAAGQPGGVYIAVVASHRARAVEALREAHGNGYLEPGDGELL